MTILAVLELCVFMAVVAPGFEWSNFAASGWAHGNEFTLGTWGGIFAAIPFAIWFFLAVEGVAMAAEEAREPHRTIPLAYITGILTLAVLATGVMIFAGGVGDWPSLSNVNDPLPRAMEKVVGGSSGWLHMLVWLGLFGLVASFHGIILGYSRQIFALARAGYLPPVLARIHPRFRTPHLAVLAGGAVGIVAIFSDHWVTFAGQSLTANIVTLSVLGAVVMYITAMLALFRLRRREPHMARPYRAPCYPLFPLIALILSGVALITLVYFNGAVSTVFLGILGVGYLYFLLSREQREVTVERELALEEALTSASFEDP